MLIGISGKMGVGKTTSAQYLSKYYGFISKSFANPLRDKAKLLFPFTDDDLNVHNKDKEFQQMGWTPREFLVKLGQFLRYYDSKYVISRMEIYEGQKIVIDDVRYEDEVNYILNKKGILIRINRYDTENPHSKSELRYDRSDTELDNIKMDFTVESFDNVDISNLYQSLDKIMRNIGIRKEVQNKLGD